MRLSICIPTYNFGAFIGETLQSILPQLEEGVEVVVLDGGSTDDTTVVVESFQRECAALRYKRRDERGGIDRDIARVVDLAEGEYCWLFCADDVMKPGAVRRMLENLNTGCDVYLCGMTLCTLDMRPLAEHRVSKIKVESQFDLALAHDRQSYFEQALTTTAFFSFASSLTFKKSRWDAIGLDEEFVGSLWAHVARFFQMIPGGLRLHYLPESYLSKRTENDSFMDKGLVHRYAIAIDGYHRLADAHFPAESLEVQHIRRAVRNEFPPWLLLRLKFTSERERPDDVPTVDRLAAKAYVDRTPRNLVYRLIYKHTPRALFRAAQATYRPVRSINISIRTLRQRAPRAAAR
ncbi:MAG: glycosyltransferase family 2 protein [Solirubrobacteraceae bacterium]